MGDGAGARLGFDAARRLAHGGYSEIGPGLTDSEFSRIEQAYGFEFADDHRGFLAAGLPINGPIDEGATWKRPWPDWRDGDPDELRRHLDWPIDSALFDVEHNGLWHGTWGERPADLTAALQAARARLAQAPTLVPVYAHRFLPAGRGTFGHPVMSIWLPTDMIYYGTDLADYIDQEFGGPGAGKRPAPDRRNPQATVLFWRDFL